MRIRGHFTENNPENQLIYAYILQQIYGSNDVEEQKWLQLVVDMFVLW